MELAATGLPAVAAPPHRSAFRGAAAAAIALSAPANYSFQASVASVGAVMFTGRLGLFAVASVVLLAFSSDRAKAAEPVEYVRICTAGSTGRRNTGVKSQTLGFQISRSDEVVRLADEPLVSDELASAPTSRCPLEGLSQQAVGASRSTRAATGFADRKNMP